MSWAKDLGTSTRTRRHPYGNRQAESKPRHITTGASHAYRKHKPGKHLGAALTTIVMIEQDDNVFIGYDSRMSGGNNKIESPNHKVFANNGNVYGVAGGSMLSTALAYAELPKLPPEDRDHQERWVTKKLIPAIRKVLDTAEPDNASHDIMILAAVNGKVFEISGTLGWTRSTSRQYAIGSGSYYALGAMSAGASAWQAVTIAAEHDHHTGDTFYIITASELLAK